MSTVYFDKAYFVEFPRSAEELKGPHLLDREENYEIADVVRLNLIDFENFVTDMLVERSFLEENAHSCIGEGTVKRCLLVKSKTHFDAVLVVPCENAPGYVHWAAYIPDVRYGALPPFGLPGEEAEGIATLARQAAGIAPRNDMEKLLTDALRPGLYRHFKGGLYRLFSLSRHSETEELMAVYQPLYGEREIWVRPAGMLIETVERDGESIQRFIRIGD